MPNTATAPARPELAGELDLVLVDLGRLVRREARKGRRWPSVTASQSELLSIVSGRPGISVNDLARALHVAPNTVSTLVGRLVEAGLLVRRPDARDGRAVRLYLTPVARRRFAIHRREGERVLDRALKTMSGHDRNAIALALPAFERMIQTLAAVPTT